MTVAIIYFVVLIALFFVLIVLPQRRRGAAQRAFVASLQVGDEVFTTGGILGTITALEDEMVDLEVAPGVVLRVARVAIAQAGPTAVDADDAVPTDLGNADAGGPPMED